MRLKQSWFAFTILGMGLLFGLSIPRYSFLAILLCACLVMFQDFHLPRCWRISVPTLFAFTLLHEGLSFAYGYRQYSALFVHPLMFLSAYFVGLVLPSIKPFDQDRWMARYILVICLGMAVYALLSSFLKPIQIEGADLLRRAPSFWDRSYFLNGTVYGLYASTGLCLLPIALLGWGNVKNCTSMEGLLASSAFLCGMVANVLFQNRAPYFALGLAAVITSVLLLLKMERRGPLLIRLVSFAAVVMALVWIYSEPLKLVFLRFEAFGLTAGGRSDAWYSVLSHILEQPFGGRNIGLTGLSYAHNMWLDVANDSGLFPALLLVAFCLLHVPAMKRLLFGIPSVESITILCVSSALAMGAMVEPLLLGSIPHFVFICLILGLMAGVTRRSSC